MHERYLKSSTILANPPYNGSGVGLQTKAEAVDVVIVVVVVGSMMNSFNHRGQ